MANFWDIRNSFSDILDNIVGNHLLLMKDLEVNYVNSETNIKDNKSKQK